MKIFLKSKNVIIEKGTSYYKEILNKFFEELGSLEEMETLQALIDELPRFRHLFSRNKDLLYFDEQKINELKRKVLKNKNDILQFFEEVIK